MISFSCPNCQVALKTADDKAGLRSKCPKCGCVVSVPNTTSIQVIKVSPIDPFVADRHLVAKDKEILDVLPADDIPTLEEVKTPLRQVRSKFRSIRNHRPRSRQASSRSGSRFQYYSAPLLDLYDLECRLCDWLEREDFNTQVLETEEGDTLIQVEKQGSWRNLVGMSTALNIVLNQGDEELYVEIGAGKWVDKAAVGVVSLFILWPLAVTAALGAWEQTKMPERIFGYISDYVHRVRKPTSVIRNQSRRPIQDAPSGSTDTIGQLKELALLRERGILTEEEFQAQKARILK